MVALGVEHIAHPQQSARGNACPPDGEEGFEVRSHRHQRVATVGTDVCPRTETEIEVLGEAFAQPDACRYDTTAALRRDAIAHVHSEVQPAMSATRVAGHISAGLLLLGDALDIGHVIDEDTAVGSLDLD